MNNKKICLERYDSILLISILILSILEYNLKYSYRTWIMELTILVILLNIIYIIYKFYRNKTIQNIDNTQ